MFRVSGCRSKNAYASWGFACDDVSNSTSKMNKQNQTHNMSGFLANNVELAWLLHEYHYMASCWASCDTALKSHCLQRCSRFKLRRQRQLMASSVSFRTLALPVFVQLSACPPESLCVLHGAKRDHNCNHHGSRTYNRSQTYPRSFQENQGSSR